MDKRTTPQEFDYFDAFIQVAPDSAAEAATAPPQRGEKASVAQLEYELLHGKPYTHTQADILFEVHLRRQGLEKTKGAQRQALRDEFFLKSHACLRASALGKRYGWGVHFDAKGRAALVPMDSPAYERLAHDPAVRQFFAMRSKRA